MGVINHGAVIATTCLDDAADTLRAWIAGLTERDRSLFSEQRGWTNGYRTFFLGPDGSKEGWADSELGDSLRREFIEQLGDRFEWIEVSYGEFGQGVVRGNNENLYEVNGTSSDE